MLIRGQDLVLSLILLTPSQRSDYPMTGQRNLSIVEWMLSLKTGNLVTFDIPVTLIRGSSGK